MKCVFWFSLQLLSETFLIPRIIEQNITCLPAHLPNTYLPTYLPPYLPTHPPTYLPTYTPTYLPACLPDCRPSIRPFMPITDHEPTYVFNYCHFFTFFFPFITRLVLLFSYLFTLFICLFTLFLSFHTLFNIFIPYVCVVSRFILKIISILPCSIPFSLCSLNFLSLLP